MSLPLWKADFVLLLKYNKCQYMGHDGGDADAHQAGPHEWVVQQVLAKLVTLFLDDAVAVGVQQLSEVGHLGAQLLALVGVGHEHAVG